MSATKLYCLVLRCAGVYKPALRTAIMLLGLAGLASPALALEYRSVTAPAVFYDGPELASKKLYAVSSGYPVEVIVDLKDWVKVRDSHGELAWVQASSLGPQHMLVVTAESAVLRQVPNAAAAVVARVGRDVLLEFVDASTAGWVKVRHRDGAVGYVAVGDVWGE